MNVRTPHTVVTVLDRRVAMFELGVPCEVFGIPRPELHDPWYRHIICSTRRAPIDTGQGVKLQVEHGLEVLEVADTVVLGPPFGGSPSTACDPMPDPAPELIDALRTAHDRGARLLSVCSGAFTLAATGLLDGKRATTHWMHAAALAAQYPRVEVDPGVLYVDEGSILTSAGTAAGIDLCLHVVRLDLGAEVANAVARRMVVPPHRDGGQAQFVDVPVPSVEESDALNETMAWAAGHLADPLSVQTLAARAAMSPRTFARRFAASTGTTPRQWLIAQRVLLAQRLLETTDDSVDRIAEMCGFGGAAGLRQHFERRVKASPQAYRRTFRRAAS
ncbi:MAG TPA: helix-turn-helix domain-containing protein [Acidimicrobiales bacterium]|nr:helix-turn-helix domain-containing protein [Acidimicrobiales bacterium]